MSNLKQMSEAERKRKRILTAWEIEKRKLLRDMEELGKALAKTEAERDRAVDAAVALEQEIGRLNKEIVRAYRWVDVMNDLSLDDSEEMATLRIKADEREETIKKQATMIEELKNQIKNMDGNADKDLFGTVRYAMSLDEEPQKKVYPCETCTHGKPMGGGPPFRAYTCDIDKIRKILKNTKTGEYNCYFYEEAEG